MNKNKKNKENIFDSFKLFKNSLLYIFQETKLNSVQICLMFCFLKKHKLLKKNGISSINNSLNLKKCWTNFEGKCQKWIKLI